MDLFIFQFSQAIYLGKSDTKYRLVIFPNCLYGSARNYCYSARFVLSGERNVLGQAVQSGRAVGPWQCPQPWRSGGSAGPLPLGALSRGPPGCPRRRLGRWPVPALPLQPALASSRRLLVLVITVSSSRKKFPEGLQETLPPVPWSSTWGPATAVAALSESCKATSSACVTLPPASNPIPKD